MQLKLFQTQKYNNKGMRKRERPISLRGSNHIVLRANSFTLRKNHYLIKEIIKKTQTRYGLKLRVMAIMSNHLHLMIQVASRKVFADAMRYLASQIALKVHRKARLWSERVWSRPIQSRRDFNATVRYIFLNPIREKIFDLQIDSFLIQSGLLREQWDLSFAEEKNGMWTQLAWGY